MLRLAWVSRDERQRRCICVRTARRQCKHVEALTGNSSSNVLNLMDFVLRLLGSSKDLLDLPALICAVEIMQHRMVGIEFAEGRYDVAVKVMDDVITDTNWKCLACREWARRIDDALDKFMDAGDDNLSIGPRGSLAYMIQDSMRLVGVAGTEDCKDQCTDWVKAEEEKLVDELILD